MNRMKPKRPSSNLEDGNDEDEDKDGATENVRILDMLKNPSCSGGLVITN